MTKQRDKQMRLMIEKALKAGQKALSEHESKRLLAAYGVPVVPEHVATDADGAVHLAEQIGYPVVLKGLGATLLHKTERGLVHLNLANKSAVARAARAIIQEAGDELEGILVQPLITGKREFVAGLSHDPVFGPTVMFGLGGIFTEALADISLRIAPLSEHDAQEQIGEIKAGKLLGPFRGEKAVDRAALVRTLMALSTIAREHPEISEIDINPLLVSPEGKVYAVDALVVLSAERPSRTFTPKVDPRDIRNLFYPKAIAFIGASSKLGKWGHMLLAHTINGGFPGEIYLVNAKGGTIAGRSVYTSIAEVPGKVDLAVVTIPAAQVLDLLPQLKRKGIHNVLLITSGFGETGTEGDRKSVV